MWGAVGLVLLIACMNVAGLFLVHGDARRQEMTLRATLGASRSRILSQLLTESLLLSLAAGVLGVLAAFWMIKGIVAVCPPGVDTIEETRIDRTVLFFTLGLSVIVGLAFGLLPAWKAGGMRSARALRTQASGPVLDRGWRRLCHGLVVAQIAIALTLLVGVGMLIQSLVLLQREDLGFAPAMSRSCTSNSPSQNTLRVRRRRCVSDSFCFACKPCRQWPLGRGDFDQFVSRVGRREHAFGH